MCQLFVLERGLGKRIYKHSKAIISELIQLKKLCNMVYTAQGTSYMVTIAADVIASKANAAE